METLRAGLVQPSPLLNSVFNEVIRFYSTGISMRDMTREMHIGGSKIPPGSTILIPQGQFMLDQGAFGLDAQIVNNYHFFHNKELERHEFYRPFGQGITRCSRKTIGLFESSSFVAWALWRYDLKMVHENQRAADGTKVSVVPRIGLKKPSLGISKQVKGDDMLLEISCRTGVKIPMWARS